MMNESLKPAPAKAPGLFDRLLRRLAFRGLRLVSEGKLEVHDRETRATFGEDGQLHANVRVRDPDFYRQLVLGGSLGASEAFVRGAWECEDLTTLFRILVRNQAAADLDGAGSRLSRFLQRMVHRWHANTRTGSRDNIRAHYDLGNKFFRLWLDDTWAYSCGIFASGGTTLREASLAKFDRVCRKLALHGDDHLLEIGAGWGGLARHAAERFGCRVTTTTISQEQFDLANQNIRKAGLANQISVLCQDYRDLAGQFDKLVSIEMIEAVGHEYLDAYLRQCGRLLKPQGTMLLQAIVMPEGGYRQYLRSVDFIRRYIFPGGCLPSVAAILESAGRASRLRLVHLEDMAPHYAETLRRWRANFEDHVEDVRRLGYSDEFIRLWNYYLCYCEAAFEERHVGVVQMVFDNHACRRDPLAITQAANGSHHHQHTWSADCKVKSNNAAACVRGRS